jgi:hypothetical protein
MTAKTTTTTALILATFALVGLMTTGALVPAAFAQAADEDGTSDPLTGVGGLLGDLLAQDGQDDSNGGTDGTETERETTEQSGDQSETADQTNSLDQDQTAAINGELGSGSGSEVASDAESSAESNYKTKSKDGSTPIPGTSTADGTSDSNVSNTGTIGQNQELNNARQVNNNEAGSDSSRAAVVGFDFEFEQSSEELQQPPVDNDGTDTASIPLVIP